MVTLSIGRGFLIKLPKLYKPARHPLANTDICKPFWARAFGLWTETEEQTPQHEISIFSELKLHWLPILFCLLKLSKGRTGNGSQGKMEKNVLCHFQGTFQGAISRWMEAPAWWVRRPLSLGYMLSRAPAHRAHVVVCLHINDENVSPKIILLFLSFRSLRILILWIVRVFFPWLDRILLCSKKFDKVKLLMNHQIRIWALSFTPKRR